MISGSAVPIEIGVYVEKGLVIGARSTIPGVQLFVADDDNLNECGGGDEISGQCSFDETQYDRESHKVTRKLIADYLALPIAIY
jgi:hypothetical protein